MWKHLAVTMAAATLLTSISVASEKTAVSAPTTGPMEFGQKLALEIKEVAKIDAPGASGFAAAMAGVLKKHSLQVPEVDLTAKPSAALPKLSEAQIRAWSSQTVTNLLDHISYVGPRIVEPSEGALRTDLLEALCRYAPSMALRLSAADRLLRLASPNGEKLSVPEVLVDPHRAVEVAKVVVTESLAAAQDGRDTLSMRTLVGLLMGKVASTMIGLDIMNVKVPTAQSIEKVRKGWDKQLAAFEKDANDDAVKRILAGVRGTLSVPVTDAQVEAIAAPGRCRPVAEALYKAFEKQDYKALKALLTPATAAKIAGKDMKALTKDFLGETPSQVRLISVGTLRMTGPGKADVPCNVILVDNDGKERRLTQDIHMVKTDKGWLLGE